MDNKKTRQISIVLPLLLAVSFIMLLLYMMFGMFDRKLNDTYNDNNTAASGTAENIGQNAARQNTVRHNVSCYMQVLREHLAKYGEPRAVRIDDAPGRLSDVYNSDLYYLDGVNIGLIDLDGDGIQEFFCAAIDHEQVRISGQLYSFSDGQVVLLKDDLTAMLLPEDSQQTLFVHKSAGNGYYMVNDRFNPDGKPVELMDFFEKTGTELNSAGKYSRGKMENTSPFENYIRVKNMSSIPLSVETDSSTGEAVTVPIFPQTGVSEDEILSSVQAATDIITRILMVNE